MSDGRTATERRVQRAGVDRRSRRRPARRRCTGANAGLRPTWFSHSLLCDSCADIDVPRPRFVRVELGGDLALVQAVAELVDRGEDRLELRVLLVPGRDARVLRPDPRGERVRRDVDPPAVGGHAEPREHRVDGGALGVERDAQRRGGAAARRPPRRGRQRGRERIEDLLDARGGQAEVVVGEQRVVGVLARRRSRRRTRGRARRCGAGRARRRRSRPRPGRSATPPGPRPRPARGRPRGPRGSAGCARSRAARAARGRGRGPTAVAVGRRARRASRRSSSAVAWSCASRSSVANMCARAGAPPGGIIVRWSQPARRARAERSASSASRARRASRAGGMPRTLRRRRFRGPVPQERLTAMAHEVEQITAYSEFQNLIYAGGQAPPYPVRWRELEAAADGGDDARGRRLRRGRGRRRGDDARQPRGLRPLADRPADAARRRHARPVDDDPRHRAAGAAAARRRSACSRSSTPTASWRRRAPRAASGVPYVHSTAASTSIEDVAEAARRRPALVPALLPDRPRPGGELRRSAPRPRATRRSSSRSTR